MPEPVHEGNLDDDAREQHIRQAQHRFGSPDCQCVPCFLLRRLDDARAQHQQTCDAFNLTIRTAIDRAIDRRKTEEEPNLSAPVRSAPASRTRETRCPLCGRPAHEHEPDEWQGHVAEEWEGRKRVRVEVRPVIDATPRTPPLGHWWTANLAHGENLGPDVVVSSACVIPGCGLGPEAHE